MPTIGPLEAGLAVLALVLLLAALLGLRAVGRTAPERGQAFLKRWGLADPTPRQGEEAAAYLRERRRLFVTVLVVIVTAVTAVTALVGSPPGDWAGYLVGAFFAALLGGELLAALRGPTGATRAALLVRRDVSDLVPVSGLVEGGIVLAGGVATSLVALASHGWARRLATWHDEHAHAIRRESPTTAEVFASPPESVVVVAGFLGLLVLVAGAAAATVWLTLVRAPITSDGAVDSALRIRTARVAVGTAALLVPALSSPAHVRLGELVARHAEWSSVLPPALTADLPAIPAWVSSAATVSGPAAFTALVCAVVVWVAMINPLRRQRLVDATR